MYSKALLTAALVAALALPVAGEAMAKTKTMAKTYYAEQSLKSKYCYAVAFKPNPKYATMIGSDSFTKLSAAMAAIKADPDCKAPHMAKAKVMKAKAPMKPKA